MGIVTGSALAGFKSRMDTFHIQGLSGFGVALKAKLGLLFLEDEGAHYAMALVAGLAILLGHRGVNQLLLKSRDLFSVTLGAGLGSNSHWPRGRYWSAAGKVKEAG